MVVFKRKVEPVKIMSPTSWSQKIKRISRKCGSIFIEDILSFHVIKFEGNYRSNILSIAISTQWSIEYCIEDLFSLEEVLYHQEIFFFDFILGIS